MDKIKFEISLPNGVSILRHAKRFETEEEPKIKFVMAYRKDPRKLPISRRIIEAVNLDKAWDLALNLNINTFDIYPESELSDERRKTLVR